MDLNELLSYKPDKRAGGKRPLEEGQGEGAPASKAPRPKLGSERINRAAARPLPNPLTAALPQDTTEKDLNGITDEEKLKLLLSMDDEDDNIGKESPL